uniref:Uncharacterized protein n=1 Tax=Ditylenchus dipsaci TaxID=166011 RepID=A0A915EF20_9BILA
MPHSSRQYNKDDFEVPLLGDYDDEYGMAGTEEAKEAIEDLFEKSDATVAAARENLPSPSLEGGAFHFIDATAPDNTQRNIWLLVMLVILIFVVIPLVLTFLEEKSEAEEALHSHRHHSSSQMVS